MTPTRSLVDPLSSQVIQADRGVLGEELSDRNGDLLGVGLQGEVAGVDETDVGVGDVALEGLGAGRRCRARSGHITPRSDQKTDESCCDLSPGQVTYRADPGYRLIRTDGLKID